MQEALEVVEALPPEDQQNLIDVIHLRLVDQRRAEIAQNAEATLKAIGEGKAHFGSLDDLKQDLLGEQ